MNLLAKVMLRRLFFIRDGFKGKVSFLMRFKKIFTPNHRQIFKSVIQITGRKVPDLKINSFSIMLMTIYA